MGCCSPLVVITQYMGNIPQLTESSSEFRSRFTTSPPFYALGQLYLATSLQGAKITNPVFILSHVLYLGIARNCAAGCTGLYKTFQSKLLRAARTMSTRHTPKKIFFYLKKKWSSGTISRRGSYRILNYG